MALIKTNYPVISSWLEDFFGGDWADWRSQNYSASNTTLPKVNITENDTAFTIEMAAPGLKKDDFKIQLNNNLLTISSEKKEEKKDEGTKPYTRQEFSYQAFTRSFTLPESANGEKISAAYQDGILTVTIPKREEAKPQKPKEIAIS
jgi:HSP20 family protein